LRGVYSPCGLPSFIFPDIVKAAKAGDGTGVDKGQKRWHTNADDIAAFSSSANPNWSNVVLTPNPSIKS
jgi:hypothetical protein